MKKNQKLKVGVLMGGPSSERDVSLVTGKAIYKNLDREKYSVKLIELTKKSQFVFIADTGKKRVLDLVNKDRRFVDLMFIALHGTPGEDGAVQGMFDLLNIPYTGSQIVSSALCMNKTLSAVFYEKHCLATPKFIALGKKDWQKNHTELVNRIMLEIGFPVVIKPVDQGSAVGVYIPQNKADLEKTIPQALRSFDSLLAQQFIKGKEVTCGVLEKNGLPFALPPTRIIPNLNGFYDYASKYMTGGSTHVCPADFSPKINQQIQEMAIAAHQALGCRGMSRTDIFVDQKEKLWVLETNTIPGMTPTSLLPEAAQKAGISFSKMLDLIIKSSL